MKQMNYLGDVLILTDQLYQKSYRLGKRKLQDYLGLMIKKINK